MILSRARHGFTIVEIAIVIAILAALVAITAMTFANIQQQARDTERKNDVIMIKNAMEKYKQDNGEYPQPATLVAASLSCAEPNPNECWKNQWIQFLYNSKYLNEVVVPGIKNNYASGTRNHAPDGTSYYGYVIVGTEAYGIYVPLSTGDCKTGVNVSSSWWGAVSACDF